MNTLSDTDLALVTGGKADASTGTRDDEIPSTLRGIQSSLDDLGKSRGPFAGRNGLLFMTMALAMTRQRDVVVCGTATCRRRRCW